MIELPSMDAHSSVRARHSSKEPSSETGGGASTARAAFSPAMPASAANDWPSTACGLPNSASSARNAMGGKPLAFATRSHDETSVESVTPKRGAVSVVGNRKGVMLKFSYTEIEKLDRAGTFEDAGTRRCRKNRGAEPVLNRCHSAQSSSRYPQSFTTWPNGRLSRAAACIDNLNHGSATHTHLPGQAAA